MLLVPNRMYVIDKDCSYGFYLIANKSSKSDVFFNLYQSLDKSDWFNHVVCYFGCVEVKPPYKCIEVVNGNALFIGENPFDLYEVIEKAALLDDKYNHEGLSIYKNQICEIRAYYRDRTSHFFLGDIAAEIVNQFVFSINEHYFWGLSLDVRSFKMYDDLQIGFKSTTEEKEYVFGEEGCSFRSIKYVEFDTKGNNLHRYSIDKEDFYIIELPNGVNPLELSLSWIHPNNTQTRLFPTEKAISEVFADEYKKFGDALLKYRSIGLEIDLNDELRLLDKAPDFAEVSTSFLERIFAEYEKFKNKHPKENLKYTFHVGATFNKKYYCAAKLAERAIDVQVNSDNTIYYITFEGNQIEDIALMYYDLVTPFNADKDYMIEILEYLEEFDYFTFLEKSINLEISSLRKEYGYSSYVTQSVFVNINKSINKYRRRQLTALYNEMIEENRVKTKWSSEYRLYSIIKSYVPDAIYQYRTGWLGSQSFDIYLPSIHTAIEYQGQQHYEPVEAFGGKEGFQNNVQRDARKRKLALEHSINVLEWNYSIPVRDESVKQFLSDNNIAVSVRQERKISMPIDNLLLSMAPPVREKKNRKKKKG